MKKKTLIITCIILLVTLLIPIPQKIFLYLLGALLLSSLVFLLLTISKKKILNSAPKIFSILLIIIVGFELHFTKNLIFNWDYQVFGEQIGQLNYIISFVILALIFIFNQFFTINFIYKETIKFDPLTDMNSQLFRLDGEAAFSQTQIEKKKEDVRKATDYFSHLQNAHKQILTISVITGLFAILQFIVIYFFKHGIILEPTFGNMIGFNVVIFISTLILELTAFAATKKYRILNSNY